MLKKIIMFLFFAGLTGVLIYFLLPSPPQVNVLSVQKGEFIEFTEDEGVTSLRHTYKISAPLNGFMQRIDLEVGDNIQQGQKLFSVEPAPVQALDLRAHQQALHNLEAAESRYKAMIQTSESARHEHSLIVKEYQRNKLLFEQNLISQAQMDRYEAAFYQSQAGLRAIFHNVKAAGYEVSNARAVLDIAAGSRFGENSFLYIKSPVSGVIIGRERYQEGPVISGESILKIADLNQLEVRVDLLSVEAVRIKPGMEVIIEHWGGEQALTGVVRMIEPTGFTKVSALGVDEQRVPVYITLNTPRDDWQSLGYGYRVEARFIISRYQDAVYIPTSALFRQDDKWTVFVIIEDRIFFRAVEPGTRSGLFTMIEEGLEPGELIVNHPGDNLHDGQKIEVR
ncbi:efflux RND transporter periplasmic adaptor subunit [Desulfonatronovibrio magnus]|uniref:efflux RND transporter periplasmic adaptor subunit n=1 Tax=Desulfonatronovibrio magnus TaxID=698827 RepID=UPI0005EBC71A|nr:HlyD family efflux transporter periplasmic adaptor subunit [Desulfonatronovibrio magnus]